MQNSSGDLHTSSMCLQSELGYVVKKWLTQLKNIRGSFFSFFALTVIPCDEAVYIDFLENNLKTLSSLPTFPFCCYLLTINQNLIYQ